MNKRDPNAAIDDFQARIRESHGAWRSICAATNLPLALRRQVSRDAFIRVSIAWEVFRSDWHVAAAAKDISRLARHVDDIAARQLRNGKDTKGLIAHMRVDLPRQLSLSAVREILDPDGGNVELSAKNAGSGGAVKWQKQATAHLAPAYARVVTGMPIADLKIASLVEHLRDCLVHESHRSTEALRSSMASIDPADRVLFAGKPTIAPAGLPMYLHRKVGDGHRVEHFHDRLDRIAEAMRT